MSVDMRRLGMIAFMLLLVGFGTYFLVVQRISLDLFYPPTSFQFPNYYPPAAMPTPTPGPLFHSEFSENPVPPTSAPSPHSRAPFKPAGIFSKYTPLPLT